MAVSRAPAVALATVAIALSWVQFRIGREHRGPVETLGETGSRRMLLVYHAAFEGFQKDVSGAFAKGAVEAGWRVDRTAASATAPVDLHAYGVLVLGVETYWFAPDSASLAYLRRASPLGGKPVIVLLTGAGETRRAERLIRDAVAAAGGRLLEVRPFGILRPNDETDPRANRAVALDHAFRMGLAAL